MFEVARCPNSGERDCKFFLWEEDEFNAKASRFTDQISHVPPTPLTPRTPRTPRPNREHQQTTGFGDTFNTGPQRARARSVDTSPTPQRHMNTPVAIHEKKYLFTEVMELLRLEAMDVSSTVQTRLQLLINRKIGMLEAELQAYRDTLDDVCSNISSGY